jgi:predicted Rdx family selenoprotein
MAMEFWRRGAVGDVALRLTPGDKGRLEVYLDGEKIFDRKEDGGYPNWPKINEIYMVIAEKIYAVEEATAAG